MRQRVQIIVTGKVQGVFFRASTREKAKQLGIGGFARNQPDGRVEIIADGDQASLQQFIAWCHEGPPLSRVENVIVTDMETSHFFDHFEIK
jgi:acylphosphatase